MESKPRLEQIIERAAQDPALEPVFLRALLDAPLYVHLPLSDDSGRVRIVQFTRPDGIAVIPVFTAVDKATTAAQGAVRVACVQGRELLECTRGATLMLNPNDLSTMLYPEEISLLLDQGIAQIAPMHGHVNDMQVIPADPADSWLADHIAAQARAVPGVFAVYLLSGWRGEWQGQPTHYIVAVGAPQAASERIARAIALVLAEVAVRISRPVDLVTFGPDETFPEWLQGDGVEAIWTRDP
ncbi:SseB family protein [Cognatilysobacter segetis]|uniref:SseB family protein n=1 Tax=Cognatilysobacter segetis TaxID=2492394 RepID=UPI0013902B5E|nr:SseB family protein [Lysobacter segetis]